ncbi:AraC family transcriptional regulator [Acinetobacter rathckeae]|uniref:AraC family transcriptional regulator n=1 Tax=Acinetobacter rathckeae TaxID=2605272 RepID=UPI0018A2B262|nr:AraC family transcriptional regulator [Acinetobacter rathckeae]MBF7688932.1 AraC family transcriptional regulator [Acinetobacter rathckeae]MBF7696331.1 AraC family transcriptional regulator [Acinetobacter rathckeae]
MQNHKESVNYLHLRELGGLGLLKAHYHQKQFSKHVHEEYCIGVITRGAQAFSRKGQNHIAPKGDIILVNADEVHTGSSALSSGWSYRAIYPTPEMLIDISQDFFSNKGEAPWFEQAVVHDEGLARQLCLLFDLLEEKDNLLFKETMYLSTIACLMAKHGRRRREVSDLSNAQSRILLVKDFISSHSDENLSLDDLATLANLSPWHFLREFKKNVGLPPHAWLLQVRLIKAQQLLKKGEKVTSVALKCGFSDQSHFNRHFKKAVGVTPSQYIANIFIQ